jgi:hypothetical protein
MSDLSPQLRWVCRGLAIGCLIDGFLLWYWQGVAGGTRLMIGTSQLEIIAAILCFPQAWVPLLLSRVIYALHPEGAPFLFVFLSPLMSWAASGFLVGEYVAFSNRVNQRRATEMVNSYRRSAREHVAAESSSSDQRLMGK